MEIPTIIKNHYNDTLKILELNGFDKTYLEYKKMMHDFFIYHKKDSSIEFLEENIKTVFGEDSHVLKEYKMRYSLYQNEGMSNGLTSSLLDENNNKEEIDIFNPKKIFTITMVKNEMDIIESFIRYNLNIVDGMIILDKIVQIIP